MPEDNENNRDDKKNIISGINKKVDKISLNMEKMKLVDYIYYLEHPRKMLWPNFVGGLARGLGIAVGFTLLGALVIYFLQFLITLNLPGISEFIGKLVKLVEFYLRSNA
jgi:hypothetical protein